jgi:xanthine dehydrogenase/oxidase
MLLQVNTGTPCNQLSNFRVESSTEEVLATSEPTAPKEFIFPPALIQHELKSICFKGDKSTWFRPLTLAGLLELKHQHNDAKIVMGSSELTIEARFKNSKFPVLISPTAVPELSAIECNENEIIVGAAVTLTNLRTFLQEQIEKQPSYRTKTLQSVVDQLRYTYLRLFSVVKLIAS